MGGRHSRTKGHSFEREIATRFRVVYPHAQRNLNEVRHSDGFDLENTGRYLIQCKRLKKYASITKIFEVPEIDGKVPMLITKGDRLPTMAVLPLDELLKLLEATNDNTISRPKENEDHCRKRPIDGKMAMEAHAQEWKDGD